MRTSFGRDKCMGVQVKLWNPTTTCAVPKSFRSEVPSLWSAISSLWPLPSMACNSVCRWSGKSTWCSDWWLLWYTQVTAGPAERQNRDAALSAVGGKRVWEPQGQTAQYPYCSSLNSFKYIIIYLIFYLLFVDLGWLSTGPNVLDLILSTCSFLQTFDQSWYQYSVGQELKIMKLFLEFCIN